MSNGKQATKIQNENMKENICLNRESNQLPLAFQRGAFNHLAMLTLNDLLLKLQHYVGISIKTCCNASMKLIMVLFVNKKKVTLRIECLFCFASLHAFTYRDASHL